MSVSLSFGKVKKMLNDCAPGHTIKLKTHFRVVYWAGLTFANLPKFKTMEIGHVRAMIRKLGIEDCAKGHIPVLFPKKSPK